MPEITRYIDIQVCERIRAAVAEADGNEVFFVGYTDDDLIVHDVQVIARGNSEAVPAVMSLAQEADVVIHNHPSGLLQPSEADLTIAANLDDFSVAFYIVDNSVSKIYVVVEPFAKREIQPLEADDIEKLLLPDGLISRQLTEYENRPQQLEMIQAVVQAFNENQVAAIEAGTGTGKTLAYLLPAIYWTKRNKERVVISTNTINLQEQLIKKDIPLLQKALTEKFDAVLVKGRSNYVCLRKVDEIDSEIDFHSEEEEIGELKSLIGWARSSQDGSKADLSVLPKSELWEKIAAESDTCTHSKCLHFRDCFVNRARRMATKANILVVNHHLLFADLAIRHQTGSFQDAAVLPPYQRIIFDEAHHIEDVATSYFGSQVTRVGIMRILNRLHRRVKTTEKGHLHSLRFRILKQQKHIPEKVVDQLMQKIRTALVPGAEQLGDATNQIMNQLFRILADQDPSLGDNELKVRLLPHVRDQLFHASNLADSFKDYIQTVKSFADGLKELVADVKNLKKYCAEEWDSQTIEISAQAERLIAAADILDEIIFEQDETNIRWIEAKAGRTGYPLVRFQMSPLQIKGMMKEAVFDAYQTIIMTSATLTIENSFSFLAERVGLDALADSRKIELILPSPFDFERQVIFAVPVDMPDPRHATFSQELAKAIFKAITITEGRAFILFTSYGLLNIIYQQLKESLQLIGITALKQGAENRHELLRRFKKDKTSVLFATDSFWEGVDVQGDALESVIITKLPFQVPSEPVIQARYEAIEKMGGNPFMDYAVP
ncbi:MAG: DEAD/DEAH box helicase, partial [Calditrichaeota bacterium]